MSETTLELVDRIDRLVNRTEKLIESRKTYLAQPPIENVDKFLRLLSNERKFFQRMCKLELAPEHDQVRRWPSRQSTSVNAGNLMFYESLVELMETLPGVIAVYTDFKFTPAQSTVQPLLKKMIGENKASTRVDIVASYGLHWIRVKSSKTGMRDRFDAFEDESSSSEDDVDHVENVSLLPVLPVSKSLRMLKSLREASEQNQVHYNRPQVIIFFSQATDVSDGIKELLNETQSVLCKSVDEVHRFVLEDGRRTIEEKGIVISRGKGFDNTSYLRRLNLDVSALLSLISYTCHHDPPAEEELHPLALKTPAIVQQIANETQDRFLPHLEELFSNAREMFVTNSVYDKFWTIVTTMGGIEEYEIANSIFKNGVGIVFPQSPSCSNKHITIIDDDPSDRFCELMKIIDRLSESLSSRSEDKLDRKGKYGQYVKSATVPKLTAAQLNLFGTGDQYKATTVTSNQWALKALQHIDNSGMYGNHYSDISIWYHPSRSLSEKKQKGIPKHINPVTGKVDAEFENK